MADTSASSSTDSSGSGWLSTLGNVASGVGNWVSNNSGLLGGLATGGVGLYQAGQATKQGNQAAGQIQAAVTPAQTVGAGTYGQLTGGPSVGGPLGQSITGQTGAAAELTGVAQQYGTGQLTADQQQQVASQVAAQKAQFDQQFAASGNMNSSARAAAHQQIDNNAAILTQQLINQNISMAEGAQTSVTSTYNSLLQNALSQAELGLRGTSAAVSTQLANDQQVSQYLQQIMSGISTQLASASGGGSVAGGTPGAQAGGAIGAGLQKLLGGGTPSVAGGGVAAGAQQLWSPTNLDYMTNTSSALGGATQGLTSSTEQQIQNWQPNLSSLDTTSGWGGYADNSSIDYSGYTGG